MCVCVSVPACVCVCVCGVGSPVEAMPLGERSVEDRVCVSTRRLECLEQTPKSKQLLTSDFVQSQTCHDLHRNTHTHAHTHKHPPIHPLTHTHLSSGCLFEAQIDN